MEEKTNDSTINTLGTTIPNYVFGWNDEMEVAKSIWGSIHGCLLDGDLLFAYRPRTKKNAKLLQIVIVKNFHLDRSGMIDQKVYDDYAVGYITSGYTALLPHVPLRYLEEEITNYLEDWGIEKEILNTYKAIIKDETPSD